jgi:hypothetical protein
MQLTYNKFKQIVDRSSEKVFEKITEALATSNNAALVSMYDDKLIVLDEKKNNLYLCDYVYENNILTFHNFSLINLYENDETYLDEVIDRYFDVDDETQITTQDFMTGFRLKYKNESKNIVTEAKDRKAKKIMNSPRLRALKKARTASKMYVEDIKRLMEEPFMKWLDGKLFNPNIKGDGSIASALADVNFEVPYPIKVNTDIGGPADELITLRDNTNVMDAMGSLASRISNLWKSDAFRDKFDKMINSIMKTESTELAQTLILSFLDENKELFVLNDSLFEEVITKTCLMVGEGNTEPIVKTFQKIMKESKQARIMKIRFLKDNNIDEAKVAEICRLVEEGEVADNSENSPSASGSTSQVSDNADTSTSSTAADGNDMDSEDVNKIIDIFKKIKKALEEDSPEAQYVDGLIAALDSTKVKGVEDSKMREIIDFLNSALEQDSSDDKEGSEDSKKKESSEVEL